LTGTRKRALPSLHCDESRAEGDVNDQAAGIGVAPMDVVLSYDGLSFLQAMIA
jgi:hypothetical protein